MSLGFVSLLFLLSVSCTQQAKNPDSPITSYANSSSKSSSGLGLIPRGIDYGKVPQVVAFASCADQNKPQPIWDTIGSHKPDLFIFMGDNVYSSTKETKPPSEQYEKLSNIPEYRRFRETFPIMATWDDHDYGLGDGGADNPEKEIYKKEFLKHFPYVKDSISWNQGGIYHVKYIGGDYIDRVGRRKIKRTQPLLQIIMLDTRYYRAPLKPSATPEDMLHRYDPWDANDKTKTVLGQEQWLWFEEQLKRPADLRFIISAIQLIPNQPTFEKWGNFPYERQRFFDLLKIHKIKNAVILSGDRHKGTIAKYDMKELGPLYEITSSAINKTRTEDETDPTYVGKTVLVDNFGLAQINWKKRRVKFEVRDVANNVGNSVEIKF
jgi:alkaline phosphatase D